MITPLHDPKLVLESQGLQTIILAGEKKFYKLEIIFFHICSKWILHAVVLINVEAKLPDCLSFSLSITWYSATNNNVEKESLCLSLTVFFPIR